LLLLLSALIGDGPKVDPRVIGLAAYGKSWLVALALGIGSFFISYPLKDHGETWRVIGVPFFVAAFDPRGFDYVGPTSGVAVIGNFLFFAALPQLILWATRHSWSRGA
jgi:hypothetical protein